ncbi:unnamed protein product [Oppiella nova]|uniref:RING-type domain-containing protein n=1 Tax=Oppiella nova TaxID=334625 RepID=A0A7R9LWF1_9ACAR|nr:unnamed protein product [Oppiella nova]CAG2166969.1 unnamed protein product [Oppiella nova]
MQRLPSTRTRSYTRCGAVTKSNFLRNDCIDPSIKHTCLICTKTKKMRWMLKHVCGQLFCIPCFQRTKAYDRDCHDVTQVISLDAGYDNYAKCPFCRGRMSTIFPRPNKSAWTWNDHYTCPCRSIRGTPRL